MLLLISPVLVLLLIGFFFILIKGYFDGIEIPNPSEFI
jgi:hypothetical protein